MICYDFSWDKGLDFVVLTYFYNREPISVVFAWVRKRQVSGNSTCMALKLLFDRLPEFEEHEIKLKSVGAHSACLDQICLSCNKGIESRLRVGLLQVKGATDVDRRSSTFNLDNHLRCL